jgi:sRNA-binding protein
MMVNGPSSTRGDGRRLASSNDISQRDGRINNVMTTAAMTITEMIEVQQTRGNMDAVVISDIVADMLSNSSNVEMGDNADNTIVYDVQVDDMHATINK